MLSWKGSSPTQTTAYLQIIDAAVDAGLLCRLDKPSGDVPIEKVSRALREFLFDHAHGVFEQVFAEELYVHLEEVSVLRHTSAHPPPSWWSSRAGLDPEDSSISLDTSLCKLLM